MGLLGKNDGVDRARDIKGQRGPSWQVAGLVGKSAHFRAWAVRGTHPVGRLGAREARFACGGELELFAADGAHSTVH